MGTQSITHPPRPTQAPLRTALLLLLFIASSLTARAQTFSLATPLLLPSALVFDSAGNLYFAETANHVIRRLDTTGQIITIAGTIGVQGFSGDDGLAVSATLDSPQGLALDSANNLYIADTHNHRIRKINLTAGQITTIAGTGAPAFSGDGSSATNAQLNLPTALALDAAGNLYLADTGNHRIRKISITGIITTIAGTGTQGFAGDSGPAVAAAIDSPSGLAVDPSNNLYLADTHNHRIRRIDAATGIITTIAGTGTQGFSGDTTAATTANLALPHGLTIDTSGNLYLADTANHCIRRIDALTGVMTTIAGDGTQSFSGDGGPAINASLDSPRGTALSPSSLVTLADTGNQRIRQLNAAPSPSTTLQTVAGLGLIAPGTLTLTAPSIIPYGTGQLTATLASNTAATGTITFFDNVTTIGSANLISGIATLSTTTLPAGSHNVSATYAGDPTHGTAQSSTLALTVTPRQLTAAINPIILLYGQPIPALTGTLTGVLPQDASTLSAAFATTATTLSPTGSYPVTATLTGSAAGNYTILSPVATITIKPAPTVITLSNPNPLATPGSSIALSAYVASTTTGTPTGSITLLDTGVPLFTSPISSSGAAIFTIGAIAQGAHSFTAVYSGNTNFAASTSTPQLLNVGTGATSPDFSLNATGVTTQTIPSGSSADYTFTVQLQGNMSSPITLAATGLPNLATASFNPPVLPPGSSANTFTLTIATPNTTAKHDNSPSTRKRILWALLLLPVATHIPRRNPRIATRLFILMLLAFTLSQISGCGDRISAADALSLSAKPYTITVTGTATTPTGSILQHSTTVTLLLEQPQ